MRNLNYDHGDSRDPASGCYSLPVVNGRIINDGEIRGGEIFWEPFWMKNRQRILTGILVFSTLFGIFAPVWQTSVVIAASDGVAPEPVVEPELQAQFMVEQEAGYMIQFRHQPNLDLAFELDWDTRGRFVVNTLQLAADKSQQRVQAYLDAKGVEYQSFWINNTILVNSSDQTTFNGLLSFVEIDALRARRRPQLVEPIEEEVALTNIVAAVQSNITHVGADQVWAAGYDGSGIVVANIDTGVRYTHEALINSYRGNLGNGSFDHNYNWWDPALGGSDLIPNDWHGHGSHTMGTILGSGGIGMAPGAQWIACQAFEGNDSELLECGQFLLAPWDLNGQNPDPTKRPHIINNSWGDCVQYLDTWYLTMINSWLAAGIYPVFSNGNNTSCGYSTPPGLNTVGNPARYGNVTAVGSTGNTDGLYASHSNWGPTDDPDALNPADYPNLKPQVVAPGVNIRSAARTGDKDYRLMSGTSMSAPHVSGLVALMWDAAPCLIGEYASTESILQLTARAVPYDDGTGNGTRSPNYATGWGEINAPAAVQAAKDYCGADFRIDAAPEVVNICAPESALYDVNVNSLMGFDSSVTLSLQNPPAGATISFQPNPLVSPGSSVLTLGATQSVAAGDHDFSIIGASGDLVHSDTVALHVDQTKPAAPALSAPANEADNISVTPTLQWAAVPQAAYYRVEVAADSTFIHILQTAEVAETSYALPAWLDNSTQYYWRVRAGNTCGLSAPAIASFTTRSPVAVLLVDDDDNNPNVRSYYTAALDALGQPYAVWDTHNSDTEPSAAQLAPYETVIWFVGDEWKSPAGPGAAGESALAAWLDTGGCLLVSGQDYLWNRGVTSFISEYLGVAAFSSDVAQTSVTGAGETFAGLGPYALSYPFYNFSDSLTPAAGAIVALNGDKGNAGLLLDTGVYKTTLWSFPLEAINNLADRSELLEHTLQWCRSAVTQYRIFLPLIEK